MKVKTPGIVNLECRGSLEETLSRLGQLIIAKGLKIFSRIDQAEEARIVGLIMRPMVLFIYGDPKVGIPFMIPYSSVAIDLPFKAFVWE